jgi:DNA-binding LacI/PurR family transcriptional regulator
MLAAGAIKAASELDVKIPRDLAIVGFDNRAFCPYLNPSLTSVALPIHQMGKTATELLLEDIKNGPSKARSLKLDCEMVVRESCGTGKGGNATVQDFYAL